VKLDKLGGIVLMDPAFLAAALHLRLVRDHVARQ